MQSVSQNTQSSQYILDELVQDIRSIRQRSFSKNPRSRTGVVAGQVLLLLLQVQNGQHLNRKSLKRFFHFVGRDAEGWRDAA